MSSLYTCGLCCSLLSVWGIVQLFLMGILYHVEALVLVVDVVAEEYDDYDDFIKETKHNYKAVAINCWICSFLYLITLGVSYTCIVKARRKDQAEAVLLENEEYFCTPKESSFFKKKEKNVK